VRISGTDSNFNYFKGAHFAGFKKVAGFMVDQGIV